MSLSACNPDRGPEYTTPAEFGEVTVSPQIMSFDSEVRVKVSVSCPYGLRNVCILYMLDGDESDVRTVAKTEPPADVTSFDYEGVIPRQRAGRKVTFRIRAITAQCTLLYAASGIYGSRRRGGRIRTTHLNNEIAILWN